VDALHGFALFIGLHFASLLVTVGQHSRQVGKHEGVELLGSVLLKHLRTACHLATFIAEPTVRSTGKPRSILLNSQ
jgi:hypothetical protein